MWRRDTGGKVRNRAPAWFATPPSRAVGSTSRINQSVSRAAAVSVAGTMTTGIVRVDIDFPIGMAAELILLVIIGRGCGKYLLRF